MPAHIAGNEEPHKEADPTRFWLWLSGLWVVPVACALFFLPQVSRLDSFLLVTSAAAIAPLPALLWFRRRNRDLSQRSLDWQAEAKSLEQQLTTIRQRVGRLREELSAANQQARLSHQLTLLGQFTAGFLHEYNNPLAIVINRLEILLDERKDDAPLCADLEQMLSEARYMSKIAHTLLRALRREQGAETFEPSAPAGVTRETANVLGPAAQAAGIQIVVETNDVPRVEVPEHTVSEVVRSLTTNAITALKAGKGKFIWIKLEPYRSPGAKIVLRVEDDGPGVPKDIQDHLFEPFASKSSEKECVGLGLFLAASLLDCYDATLRYEPRRDGGACFIVEMPAARFTREQPFHWFIKGDSF